MKRRTTPVLEVTFDIPNETVAEIQFLFKQEREESAEALLLKSYPGEVTFVDGVYLVPMTVRETALFEGGKQFYMDTRITDQTGKVPETPIVGLFMSKTLFSEREVTT